MVAEDSFECIKHKFLLLNAFMFISNSHIQQRKRLGLQKQNIFYPFNLKKVAYMYTVV